MKYKLKVQNPETVEAQVTQYWVSTLGVYMSADEFEKLYESIPESQKHIVQYRYFSSVTQEWGDWKRSSNDRTIGEFNSFEEASAIAKTEEKNMNEDEIGKYEYRAVPLS